MLESGTGKRTVVSRIQRRRRSYISGRGPKSSEDGRSRVSELVEYRISDSKTSR